MFTITVDSATVGKLSEVMDKFEDNYPLTVEEYETRDTVAENVEVE